MRLRPAYRSSSLHQDVGVLDGTAGDAGLGKKGEARRPHGIARHRCEATRRERIQLASRFLEHAQLGIQHGESGTPHTLVLFTCREHAHQRQHLGESTLLAANREHLQAIDAGVVQGVAGVADRVGLLGGVLGVVEPASSQRQQRLVDVTHELEHQEAAAFRDQFVLLENLAGFLDPTELDERPNDVASGVDAAPTVADLGGDVAQLGTCLEQSQRIPRHDRHGLQRRDETIQVVDGTGHRQRQITRRHCVVLVARQAQDCGSARPAGARGAAPVLRRSGRWPRRPS